MEKGRILYLDDEIANLNSFKAAFRREYIIFIAIDATEAFNILKSEEIEVVISDQRMPDKTGVDFFESIISNYPDQLRVLITGYSDIEAVIQAINKGKIYSYITKPWDESTLKKVLDNAIDLYRLKAKNKELSKKYKNLFANSSDAIVIFNSNGKITEYNSASEKLFNLLPTGKNKILLFEWLFDDYDSYDFMYSELLEKDIIESYHCKLKSKENTIIRALVSANKMKETDGLGIYQVIIKDVTQQLNSNNLTIKKIIEAQEKERLRLADDLHDSLGQQLASLKMKIGLLSTSKSQTLNKEEIVASCFTSLEASIKELRVICFDLMPSALEKGGFIPAFKQLAQNNFIDFEVKTTLNSLTLSKEKQIALYRVSQEFLSNTIQHAEATKLTLLVKELGAGKTEIVLKDNGKGFNINQLELKQGRGKNTMIKRIEAYDGIVNFESKIGEGTKLTIIL